MYFGMMYFDRFMTIVMGSILALLPGEEYVIEVKDVNKPGCSYTGLCIRPEHKSRGIMPVLNMNKAYMEFCEEYNACTADAYNEETRVARCMGKILKDLAAAVLKAPDIELGTGILDYKKAKEHLFIRVIKAQGNEKILEASPYTKISDLAITYHLMVNMNADESGSIIVTKDMMKAYGVTQEQLHADAVSNAQTLLPAALRSLDGCIEEMSGQTLPENCRTGIIVLTNTKSVYGASALFYPGQMEAIGKMLGGDYYVIPSSIHEVLVVKDNGEEPPRQMSAALSEMVCEVNQTSVAPEERLSNHVYHYDNRHHIFEDVETYVMRTEGRTEG